MKTKKFTLAIALTTLVMFMLTTITTQSQIQFEGLYSEGEGGAGWNADGSGPEPYGNGHGSTNYYIASRDYVDSTSSAGAHMLETITGFPLFEQALLDNGFTAGQLTLKVALASLGEDIEGIDWFDIDNVIYSNFYPAHCIFELDGEPLFEAVEDHVIKTSGPDGMFFESFLKVNNISGSSSDPVKNVANAFLSDIGTEELQMEMEVTYAAPLNGNGRYGGYFNLSGTFEKGLPTIPFKGLNADHEGFAGWDADGTGPEPFGDGHDNQMYYGASLDYDDIDPDPAACLGHLMEGHTGFLNTMLQLEYRGFEIGDLKIKMGLNSLGPDVEGEDWGDDWSNYYNNIFTFELNGEPILTVLLDTNKLEYMTNYWISETSTGKVYDISENASPEAQFVAQSFLKDLGTHYLRLNTADIHYVTGSSLTGNGRDGALWEISEGSLVGVHEKATFIPGGNISGTWTLDDSPVYVDGHIAIENGQTLIIEPGVKVAVRGPWHFDVQGCVKAEGTADENILFTRSNPNFMWDGFDFDATPVNNETSVFDHCVFQYGRAQGGGVVNSGGIFAIHNYDNIEIYNSTFRHNKADIEDVSYYTCGGAIALWNASPFIQNCIFYDNYALDFGGALFAYSGSNPVISNCLFYDNETKQGGALAFYENSNGILINSTIADNTAQYGGGLFFYDQSGPEVINSIIWENEATTGGNQVFFSDNPSDPGFYYCDIEDGQAGFGGVNFSGNYLFNLEEDPDFETNLEYPYILSGSSPCINMGTPDSSNWFYEQYLPEYCLSGNPRILNDRIDMGPYEQLLTGINDNTLSNNADFQVYPSPSAGNIKIEFELKESTFVSIVLINIVGEKVRVIENNHLTNGSHNVSYNIETLPDGIYFCRMINGNQMVTKKIIKVE